MRKLRSDKLVRIVKWPKMPATSGSDLVCMIHWHILVHIDIMAKYAYNKIDICSLHELP